MKFRNSKLPPVTQRKGAKPTESQVQTLATWGLAWPCLHGLWAIPCFQLGKPFGWPPKCQLTFPFQMYFTQAGHTCSNKLWDSFSQITCHLYFPPHTLWQPGSLWSLERGIWGPTDYHYSDTVGLRGHGNSACIPALPWRSYLASPSFILSSLKQGW